jgi:hypothetical protein
MTKAKLTTMVLSLCLGAGCSALVACGSGDEEGLLPGTSADQLLGSLDRAEQLAAEGRCTGAVLVAERVVRQAQRLGPSVKPRLKEAIVDGAQRLERLLQEPDGCEGTRTTTEPTTTETVPPVTVTTKTVTQPPPTETDPGSQEGGVEPPADEIPPDEELPPDDLPSDGDNGNNGVGNGRGGIGPR